MIKAHKTTGEALKILDHMTSNSPEMQAVLEQERANLEIARKIYELRNKARLSQKEFAARLGTTQSVVSRLEDADYDGHSIAMLQRVAAALQKRVEIRFVPAKRQLQHAL